MNRNECIMNGNERCGTVSLRPKGRDQNRVLLPVGLDPQIPCLGLSHGVLSALSFGRVPEGVEIPRVSLKSSLVVLDLSRAQASL